MNFPSECFLFTKISTPRIVEQRNGEIGCVLTCFTNSGGSIEFWGSPDSSEKMDNIEELLKFKDMLPILVQCEYCSTTHEHRRGRVNWDDEVDVIDSDLHELAI